MKKKFLDEQADLISLLKKHNINYTTMLAEGDSTRIVIWTCKTKPTYPNAAICLDEYLADITFVKSRIEKINLNFERNEVRGIANYRGESTSQKIPKKVHNWLQDKYLGF